MTFAIGFTGTRYGMTTAQIIEVRKIVAMFAGIGQIECHHGDCVGADAQFHRIAHDCGARIEVHPGPLDDIARQAGCLGDVRHRAYRHMTRNRHIVDAASLVIAAPWKGAEQSRGGTWRTVKMAREASTPLAIVWSSGAVTRERWT